ncbi:hypothetical protein P7K49_011712, partial [Saguinus oedipus]
EKRTSYEDTQLEAASRHWYRMCTNHGMFDKVFTVWDEKSIKCRVKERRKVRLERN